MIINNEFNLNRYINSNNIKLMNNLAHLPVFNSLKDNITTITLKGRIGKGGYGTVYKCVDDNGNELAVKCIENTNEGISCLMETSIMSIIQHPNINRALKIYSTFNKLYIVQELALCDLNQWRHTHSPSSEQIKFLTHSLLQAVNCLHNNNIIHGDIKASNILIYNNNTIKLSDFTLATRNNWPNNYLVCTCTHRPLEVWLDRKWNEKIDIWALGCTFFELVYGFSLFPHQDFDDSSDSISTLSRKSIVRDKYINSLLYWGKYINHPYEFQYRKASYKKFTLPPNFDPSSDINHLIISMLQLNPLNRPSTSDLLVDPFYNSLPLIPCYIISTPVITLGPRSEKKIKQLITEYSTDINVINLSYELYSRLTKLINIGDSTKIIGCIWISYKLIYRDFIDPTILDITLSKIKEIERLICTFLSFQLHCSS